MDIIQQKIAIIGAGSLGTKVIDALYQKGHRNIIATRQNEAELEKIQQKYGIEATTENIRAAEQSDVIVLCVKPKNIEVAAQEIRDYVSGKLVISAAAAKSIAEIYRFLTNSSTAAETEKIIGTKVARVMTGIFVGDEIASYTIGNNCNAQDAEIVKYIFGSEAIEVEEELLAHRTWIACYTGLLAKEIGCQIKCLSQLGMPTKHSTRYLSTTLRNVADELDNGKSGDEIFNAVGGKGSFTQKLYETLDAQGHYKGLQECIEKTVKACSGK